MKAPVPNLVLWPVVLVAAGLLLPGAARGNPADPQKPNIVLFLVDDMGWMDCGAYGSQYYETPNIDRLARQGMLFTDAYSANPLCSPTRASIMTGKYPARVGITTAAGHQPPQAPDAPRYPEKASPLRPTIQPQSLRYLAPEEYTLAEALRDAGYATAHLGKWHLGLNPEHWPEQQGFGVSFHGAPDPGPRSYFSPYQFDAGTVTDGAEGEYITDRLTDEALAFVEANRGRPFYLNLWQYGVHGPWGHKEQITKTFVGKVDPRGKQGNPIMASMLKSVDESLGRLVAKLDELGLAERTIVIFSSDNGGNVHSNTAEDPRTRNIKPGHRRWAMLADWRRYAGTQPPTNNAPLRRGKGWLYEGGVRVPLVVVWPDVVAPGSRSSEVVSTIDFYPTVLEMVGRNPQPGQHFDGQSLVPVLKQAGRLQREALFNFFPHGGPGRPPGVTVRAGDWKLIRWFETGPEYPVELELYNLREDIGETTNLAGENPELARDLNARIDRFLADTGALVPKPNPAYRPLGASRPEDPLGGWVAKGCRTAVRDGVLRIEPEAAKPFVASARLGQMSHNGPVVLKLRVRAAHDGKGQIQWRCADQEKFPTSGQVVSFDYPAGGDWQDIEIEVPVEGTLVHVRLHVPGDAGLVEIDSIAFVAADRPETGPLAEWEFQVR